MNKSQKIKRRSLDVIACFCSDSNWFPDHHHIWSMVQIFNLVIERIIVVSLMCQGLLLNVYALLEGHVLPDS